MILRYFSAVESRVCKYLSHCILMHMQPLLMLFQEHTLPSGDQGKMPRWNSYVWDNTTFVVTVHELGKGYGLLERK